MCRSFHAFSVGPRRSSGGIAAVKDRLVGKGYRFGTLQKPFAEYFEGIYFDMAGFEGGMAALQCALHRIRLAERKQFTRGRSLQP